MRGLTAARRSQAEVRAKGLRPGIYRVSLGGVVSKYVGETEKALGTIFMRVERGGGVLFLDEADALFGKRSEIASAHDRFANLATSALLPDDDDA